MSSDTAVADPPVEDKVEDSKPDKVKANYLDMSDEEFLKAPPPAAKEPETPEDKDEKTAEKIADKVVDKITDKIADDEDDDKSEPEAKKPAPKPVAETPIEKADKTDKTDKSEKIEKPAGKVEEKPKKSETDGKVDYEAFFKQIMTPFKANGKTIEVKTPDEAIRLMQMGAGYGRKIQDMQPHLKVLRMLEKNGLLDEDKISYLIDLTQKNPDAIKKLIKDGGIDPLDLSADDKVVYTPKNHAVTDREVAFHQAVAEVQGQPNGHETLRIINQSWDQESKGLLWESPELFQVIQTQRENGVYGQIAAEIDRQKMLGIIPNATPFLQAYKVAGDHLVKTNGFKAPIQNQPGNGTAPQPQVIATRTATPKPQAQNSDKAAAASSTKASASKPNLTVNPLEMSDDDFMKQFKGRF